jgi:hypothetical protein
MIITTSALIASDAIFQLSGWAEIPSTYRRPGPMSGQFHACYDSTGVHHLG